MSIRTNRRAASEESPVNRTSIGNGRIAASGAAAALTRRQVIAWGAAALGSLAIGPGVATTASAQSDASGAQTGARVSPRDLDALSTAGVLYIATVRKDGNQSNAAPVWFTVSPDHLVLIQTQPTTWKAKRIRRGSPVIVWIGRKHGPAFIGKARISSDPAFERRVIEDYPKKYLMVRFGFHKPTQEMFDKGDILSIVITPVRDLPDGFESRPGTPAPAIDETHK
ncbi:MAG TPA: pyridoxamine 5'-phosphate oxidase family protein [Candidatus Binataceae bacterium]|nr:pyridoxamine 5'-phosphate oxidase family protein [Candidatus Binataceae bacterium]